MQSVEDKSPNISGTPRPEAEVAQDIVCLAIYNSEDGLDCGFRVPHLGCIWNHYPPSTKPLQTPPLAQNIKSQNIPINQLISKFYYCESYIDD